MKCKFYLSLLLLFLSVLCSPAPTVNFSAPPFNPAQFLVDQAHNNISILGSSNTISSGVYPIKISNLTGTNYFSIDSTGVPSGYILLTTNNTVAYFPFSGGTGGSGTLTNVVFTNAGPSDTYVIGNTSYLITNSFSGGGSAGTIYNFNTNDFSITSGTNVNLSPNIPHTNAPNTFYGTQTFPSQLNVGTSGNLVLHGNGSASFASGSFSIDASGVATGNGSGLTALNAGSLSSGTVPAARLPLATISAFGAVKPDGTTILVSGGVISAVGSSSTITNLAAGQGLILTTPGGTNIFSMAQQQYDTASLAPTNALATNDTLPRIVGQILTVPTNYDAFGAAQAATNAPNIVKTNDLIYLAAFTNCVFTNTGTVPFFANHTLFIPTNSFTGGGGGSGILTLNGFGTNTTFATSFWLTNFATGNGVSFDGISFLLDGVNLNTGPGGTIGGIGNGLVALNASGISSGTVNPARLGSGTASSTTFLAGDSTYKNIPNFGGVSRAFFNLSTNVFSGNSFASQAGDMNGDGIPDVVKSGATTLSVFTNNGTGALFPTAFVSGVMATTSGQLALADLNGDGKLDVVVIDTGGTANFQVWTNDGIGNLTKVGSSYAFTAPIMPVIADVNGDGRPDILMTAGSGSSSIYTNNGAAVFTLMTNLPSFLIANPYQGAAFADMNGDGSKDLLMDGTSGEIFILTNNGSGVFQFWLTNLIPSCFAIYPFDANNDGRQDYAFHVSTSTGGVVVFTNNGSGFGQYSSNALPVTSSSEELSSGDFNADGKMDLVFASQNLTGVITLTNSGTGFGIMTTNSLPASQCRSVSAADFNQDGYSDIGVGCGSTFAYSVFLNAPIFGPGRFIGDGNALTNLPVSVSFSASPLTPAASVTTNTTGTVVNIFTNYQVQTVAGDLRYQGNLGTATNLPIAGVNFGLFPIQTNLISGQLYTNGYNRPVQVQANVGITTAAVTGDAGMALWIISGVGRGTTNYESISTTVAVSLAMSYTNQLAGFIPTNAIYAFTNISSGAGNSATLIGGQIY